MIDMNTITRQHGEIQKLAEQIGTYQTPSAVIENAFSISLLLGQLSGKITMHLQHEDKHVYPKLHSHEDSKVQEISHRFMKEMGGLVHEFTQFKAKYLSASKIKENPANFIQEGNRICKMIADRIAKEDQHLYTLVK